jgi:DNA ligase 1
MMRNEMDEFARLLDRLNYTQSRNGKMTLLRNYFLAAADPDRGYALAALTDGLAPNFPLRRVIAELVEERLDPTLFKLSRDFVGDTAETVSLMWSGQSAHPISSLHEVAEALSQAHRSRYKSMLEDWLDRLDVVGRWALLKFIGGAPRVGVSARLAKLALAEAFEKPVEEIDEIWHGLTLPYEPLFDWLSGRTEKPVQSDTPVFKPLMLSNPMEDIVWDKLDISEFAFEWKWDGIRVQLARSGGVTRLFSRSGDDISATFPEIVAAFEIDAIVDGELLVMKDGHVAPFSDLQQRLNRKVVDKKHLASFPAHVRVYDILSAEGRDLRTLSLIERRNELELIFQKTSAKCFDLSPILSFETKDDVMAAWSKTREDGVEGLMTKRKSSPYLPGRVQGHWYKMKRDPLVADCVMMYAQRGSGKRSSYYSDYTFGVWQETEDSRLLVPVGKAYSGFTDEELLKLDKFVRSNTVDQFGPVKQVKPDLVLEVAFDAIQKSARHKSGVAMRFPRINRIRWDKPAAEADTLAALMKLM